MYEKTFSHSYGRTMCSLSVYIPTAQCDRLSLIIKAMCHIQALAKLSFGLVWSYEVWGAEKMRDCISWKRLAIGVFPSKLLAQWLNSMKSIGISQLDQWRQLLSDFFVCFNPCRIFKQTRDGAAATCYVLCSLCGLCYQQTHREERSRSPRWTSQQPRAWRFRELRLWPWSLSRTRRG